MAYRVLGLALVLFCLSCGSALAKANDPLVRFDARSGFPLAADGRAAPVFYDPADAKLVGHAAQDLADDIEAVTGLRAPVSASGVPSGAEVVIVGVLGANAAIDAMVAEQKLDVGVLRGAWESFLIATVDRPSPGVERALVIVGSDRRGAAYGVYELSEAMGVSPWKWWADVTPQRHATLHVPAGARRFGPPSVDYRGIFVNDEDWGLWPWAARTFDPETADIGPKTYREIFRLMLRLKANTLWPAMHKPSLPFNFNPESARLADEYGIVMGSSHAEPMLRNNTNEWADAHERFNYVANPEGVRAYWEERVVTNHAYESMWSLGMRGIRDSAMVGADTPEAKISTLQSIFADQRRMLAEHVDPDVASIPQIFTPYKEVLAIYRDGLTVPDDVTIVWPDDNFGYIRQFPNDKERARSGGTGVYYHLSYSGAPLAYLWLGTTPPALVKEEMTRAYDQGARRFWIVNVGDIKPAETGISLFLEMAWDIDRWRDRSQREFLDDWSGRTFGEALGHDIGGLLDGYYRVNFERRPEHLQWWLPTERPGPSGMAPADVDARLARFETLVEETGRIGARVPENLTDAYYQLVGYPVRVSAAANRRYFGHERYFTMINDRPMIARAAGARAVEADAEVQALTARFNQDIAGGKWRHFMAEEPADSQWSFRISRLRLPAPGLLGPADFSPVTFPPSPDLVIEAERRRSADGWDFVEGLGRGDGTMIARRAGARLTLDVEVPQGAARNLEVGLLPFYASDGGALTFDLSIDGGPVRTLTLARETGDPVWAQGVLDNLLYVKTNETLPPGRHRVVVTARSDGLGVDLLRLKPATN